MAKTVVHAVSIPVSRDGNGRTRHGPERELRACQGVANTGCGPR